MGLRWKYRSGNLKEHDIATGARWIEVQRPTLRCDGMGGSGSVRNALRRLRLMRSSLNDSIPRVK
jgi:hypothetical protein